MSARARRAPRAALSPARPAPSPRAQREVPQAAPAPAALVLDTNVWLDWLVFDDPAVRPIADALEAGRARVYLDADCEAELARVLARRLGKQRLDAAAQAQCLARCRRAARETPPGAPPAPGLLPVCSDRDDQKFIELAWRVSARWLVTKDRALLECARAMQRAAGVAIVTPEALIAALDN